MELQPTRGRLQVDAFPERHEPDAEGLEFIQEGHEMLQAGYDRLEQSGYGHRITFVKGQRKSAAGLLPRVHQAWLFQAKPMPDLEVRQPPDTGH